MKLFDINEEIVKWTITIEITENVVVQDGQWRLYNGNFK